MLLHLHSRQEKNHFQYYFSFLGAGTKTRAYIRHLLVLVQRHLATIVFEGESPLAEKNCGK